MIVIHIIKPMKAGDTRKKYLDFFSSKGHKIIHSASLLPENDSSSLFIGSGMQPLVPYLLGEKHPDGLRLANSQKSFRQIDIEEVGDHRHNTFFEMLGNWSLGDYFKAEQLPWMFEFLTKEIGLDPKRIYVSVYRGNDEIGIPRDVESVKIWKELFANIGIDAKDCDFAEKDGLRQGRIFYYGDEKNWWSRSGEPKKMPIGEPGGPDSEIFYDLGENMHHHENSVWRDKPCHINCDCGRFIEIGNNVFMEYVKTKNGFEKLPQRNVDFGGGLERIAMAAQGKESIFQTDLFINVINKIEELSCKKYSENFRPFEVIADHLKAAVFIMGDDRGVAPSNTDQGYIVRRLIRRAIRYGRELEIKQNLWTKEIAEIIISDYKEPYPELEINKDCIINELNKEEEKFAKTLENGLKELSKLIKEKKFINGKDAFFIYSTYGFPIEMIEEEVVKFNFSAKIDKEQFNEEMKKHQELSRTASVGKFKGGLADASEETTKLHSAAHLLLAGLRKVLGDHVFQKGSNITAERLRFDFSHPEKLTDKQKTEIEKLVNGVIKKNLKVICEEMSLEEAKRQNAMGVFESKYGEKVKVYTISDGDEIFSKEICGGPHAENIGKIGLFKIQKEESSSAGVRRIKAVLIRKNTRE